MTEDIYQDFDCDLCGSASAEEIAVARHYTDGQPLHVCKSCGFVYVRRRRSANRIAQVWSDDIYESTYTARTPAVLARQTYVAEFIHQAVGLNGKSVCDIGGGEGQFLDVIRRPPYSADVFAIEPSQRNCRLMAESGIASFAGSIEDYCASHNFRERRFDIVTIMWTLENCQSCVGMMQAARELLKPGGHVVLSTGSRLLVPFKKPLHYYLGTNPADTHSFRFSANTLRGLMAVTGFRQVHVNRYIDTDYLVAVGRQEGIGQLPWTGDDWSQVLDFFDRWHRETQAQYQA